MWKKPVGVFVVIAAFAMLTFSIGVKAQTRTVTHTAVTTYTDGSLIEPGNTVTYSVWMQDNVTKAMRLGKKMYWDAKSMQAKNMPEANQYIKESYRPGWEVV